MPATDILNAQLGWDQNLGDSMNPSYGFTRKRPTNLLKKKPAGSTPWSRETENTGHVFELSWIGRTLACAQKLKWYYEQYEDGFFTYIDWDGTFGEKGRHYVGNFVTEPNLVLTANNLWDVQNVLFEEVPTVGMVQYPWDWDREAIYRYAFNDFGDQKLATFSNASPGWAPNVRAMRGAGNAVTVTTMDNPGAAATAGPPASPGNAGDWACYEYRGYGFKLYLMAGPEFGQCGISVDGVPVSVADWVHRSWMYATATFDCYAAADEGPQLIYSAPNMPLDFHRVQVSVLATKNASATAAAISWHSLVVMR
jgi:hypothetical protein